MADIFISYARPDQAQATMLARLLEGAGHAVWWDRHIRGGAAFAKDIEKHLEGARLVMVLWSEASCRSDWVKDEAAHARERGALLPVAIDGVEPPLGFRQYQTIDLKGWKGDAAAAPARAVLEAVAERLSQAPPPPPTGLKAILDKIKARPVTILACSAVVVALAVAAVTLLGSGARPGEAHETALAVLPFDDMSAEGDQAYFGSAIAEELLNVLANVDGIKVASRTSSFALKSERASVGEIAKTLGVDFVVEGDVRKSEKDIVIRAKLIDAGDDRQVWSADYERPLADMVRVQEEIATAVVEALRGKLGLAADTKIEVAAPTEDLKAYDLYLKSRELYLGRAGSKDVLDSLLFAEQAVALDPDFARGWEQLAAVYAVATSWSITGRDYSALAADAASRALGLDPNLSLPYAAIGLTYRSHRPTPWAASIESLNKAIERDAKNTSAWLWLGMDYIAVGDLDAALTAFNTCLEIEPSYDNCRRYRWIVRLSRGEFDAAAEDAEATLSEGILTDLDLFIPTLLERGDRLFALAISRIANEQRGFPHADYIAALEDPGSIDGAKLDRLRAWAEGADVDAFSRTHVALAYRVYDEITSDSFSNSYENFWLPAYADFRKSAKFKELVKDRGILAYWRETKFPPQCRPVGADDFECA